MMHTETLTIEERHTHNQDVAPTRYIVTFANLYLLTFLHPVTINPKNNLFRIKLSHMVCCRLVPVKLGGSSLVRLLCPKKGFRGFELRANYSTIQKCGDRRYLNSKIFSQPLEIISSPSLIDLLAKFNNRQTGLCLGRQMSATDNKYETSNKRYKPNEILINTPYGHIAALEWGFRDAPQKILCMHGWLDNAGSFERLIPFILDYEDNKKKYHIVAMDQPGVGHSSHKPAGADYTDFSNVLEMRRVIQHLKWDKVILLSHSLGAHLSFLYCCVFPDQVEAMISIDLTHPITRQIRHWNLAIANSIDDHFKSEYHHEDDPTTNIRVPVYSEIDAIKRLMDGHSASLTRESAEVLLKRGAKKQRWGFTFNRDVRHRHLSLEFRLDDDAMLKYLADPFRTKLFVIRASRSPYHRPEEIRLKYYDLFKKNCLIFQDVLLDGTHHLHMNDPEMVSVEVNKFLTIIDENSAQSIKSNL